MRQKGQPWEVSKAFDKSAPLTAIHPVSSVGHLEQDADVSQRIWNTMDIVTDLSSLFPLPGGRSDLHGHAGGPVFPGDRIEGGIQGLETLVTSIAHPI